MEQFPIGSRVEKITGDYRFQGWIVAVFAKRSGQIRYVVENQDGILHIFSTQNLKLWAPPHPPHDLIQG